MLVMADHCHGKASTWPRWRARRLMVEDENTALLVSNPCIVPGVVTTRVASTQARAPRMRALPKLGFRALVSG